MSTCCPTTDPACVQDQIDALEQRDVELATRIGPALERDIVLAIVCDAGDTTTGPLRQFAVSEMCKRWEADYLLAGGDNNYPDGEPGTLEANWANFDYWFQKAAIFPALGNHDLDNVDGGTPGQPQTDKFYYLPGCKRYYEIYIKEADTSLFVLNDGYKTNGVVVEPDGNWATSVQGEWFAEAVANSTARRKIAMWHEPFVSSSDAGKVMRTIMDWPALKEMDIIINGHTHVDELLMWYGIPIINVNSARAGRKNSDSDGVNPYQINGLWANTTLEWRDTKFFEGGKLSDNAGLDSLSGMAAKLILKASGGMRIEFWYAQFERLDEYFFGVDL